MEGLPGDASHGDRGAGRLDGSASWFRKRVAGLRVDYAPRDPADRLECRLGDQAQCDLWFPPVKIALGPGQCGTPPVLVSVSSYSRFITAMMLPSRTTGDLLAGMWQLMSSQLGAVPHRLIWDNEGGSGRHNRYAIGTVEQHRQPANLRSQLEAEAGGRKRRLYRLSRAHRLEIFGGLATLDTQR